MLGLANQVEYVHSTALADGDVRGGSTDFPPQLNAFPLTGCVTPLIETAATL